MKTRKEITAHTNMKGANRTAVKILPHMEKQRCKAESTGADFFVFVHLKIRATSQIPPLEVGRKHAIIDNLEA